MLQPHGLPFRLEQLGVHYYIPVLYETNHDLLLHFGVFFLQK